MFREQGGLGRKISGILDAILLPISTDGQGVGKFGQGRKRGRQDSRRIRLFQYLPLHPRQSLAEFQSIPQHDDKVGEPPRRSDLATDGFGDEFKTEI
jgi:hypothetical protein